MTEVVIVSVARGYGGAERSIEILLRTLGGLSGPSLRPLVFASHGWHWAALAQPGGLPDGAELGWMPARPQWPLRALAAARLVQVLRRHPSVPVLLNTQTAAQIAVLAARRVPDLGRRTFVYMRDFQWTGFERIFPSLPGLQVLVPALSVTRRPDYLRPWLAGLGGEIPWHVVPDMVELPAVRPQASSATPIFLHLAAVSTFKGHADLLDAATRLDAAGQPVRIDSHGHVAHRRHRKRLAARIAREGLGRHVRLAPQLHDPAPAIATSRAVLVTTRSYPGGPETFGRTIIEAWAHARPVIAYACGGPAELVDDGVDGLLVEEGNVAALAAAIARLAADPVLADRLGRAGLEKVRRRFAAATVTRQLVDLLRGETSEVA